MAIALIAENSVIEQRAMALDDVPAHKRANWRPIVGDPPDVDRDFYSVSGPVLQIEQDCVRQV